MLMGYKVIKLAAQREASGVPQLFLGDDNSNIDCMETDIHYLRNLSYTDSLTSVNILQNRARNFLLNDIICLFI
jgi:hypothetical protein